MKKCFFLSLYLVCALVLISGCGSSSSSSDDIISVTLNEVTTDFTAGPTDTGFDGTAVAALMTGTPDWIWMVGMKDAGSYDEWSTAVDGIEIDFVTTAFPGTSNSTTYVDLYWLMIDGVEYTPFSDTSFSLTVDSIGDVGGRIKGTFTATVIEAEPIGKRSVSGSAFISVPTIDITGTFNVKRYADDSFSYGGVEIK
jgi:hypothetical protein